VRVQVRRPDVPHALLAKVARTTIAAAALALGGLGAGTACAGPERASDPALATVELPAAASAPVAPTAAGSSSAKGKPKEPAAAPIDWQASLEPALELAAREKRMLLVFVHADWSAASVRMERGAFGDPRVRRATRALVALRLDVSTTSGENEQRTARLGVDVLPSVLLLDSQGERIGAIEGATDAAALLELIALPK